jgi:hypothetical protein
MIIRGKGVCHSLLTPLHLIFFFPPLAQFLSEPRRTKGVCNIVRKRNDGTYEALL